MTNLGRLAAGRDSPATSGFTTGQMARGCLELRRLRPVRHDLAQPPYASSSHTSRATALTNAAASLAPADLAPCFQAFRLPLGAPGDGPPCIRQRPLGMAGDWHGLPLRVRAPQPLACCIAHAFERRGLSVELSFPFPPVRTVSAMTACPPRLSTCTCRTVCSRPLASRPSILRWPLRFCRVQCLGDHDAFQMRCAWPPSRITPGNGLFLPYSGVLRFQRGVGDFALWLWLWLCGQTGGEPDAFSILPNKFAARHVSPPRPRPAGPPSTR